MNDNSIFTQLFLTATILNMVFAGFLIYFVIEQRRTRNRFFEEKQQLLLEQKKIEFSAYKQEAEMLASQVSKFLHDHILQLASLSLMNIHTLADSLTDEYQKELNANAGEYLDRVIEDARYISESLDIDFLKTCSLHALIEAELRRIQQLENIAFKLEGNIILQNSDLRLVIYRIAQEALLNVVKHAQASEIRVTIKKTGSDFTMNIRDNGNGFNKESLYATHGRGITQMKWRSRMINGELDIESRLNAGTSLSLVVKNIVAGNKK